LSTSEIVLLYLDGILGDVSHFYLYKENGDQNQFWRLKFL
jgi:hypothetical protein